MRVTRIQGIAMVVVLAFGLASCFDKDHGIDTAAQLAMDIQAIDEYTATNNIDTYDDPSGIRFSIETLGTKGFPPRTDQTIKVKYTGKLLDGTTFDSNTIQGVLNTFIPGWQYGLSIWPNGTKGKIFVPSPLAYGDKQMGSTIPPNSILMFDVELLDVIPSNAEKARLAADIKTIDDYLASKNIDAVKDTTGVRYVITAPGEGPVPLWFQKVTFNYSGKLFTSNTEFFSGTSTPSALFYSRVCDFISGLKLGLTKIPKNGKITLYIPSSLAFGTVDSSSSPVPANSIVIYDVELTDIIFD